MQEINIFADADNDESIIAIRKAFGKQLKHGFCLSKYGPNTSPLSRHIKDITQVHSFSDFKDSFKKGKHCFVFEANWDEHIPKKQKKREEEWLEWWSEQKARAIKAAGPTSKISHASSEPARERESICVACKGKFPVEQMKEHRQVCDEWPGNEDSGDASVIGDSAVALAVSPLDIASGDNGASEGLPKPPAKTKTGKGKQRESDVTLASAKSVFDSSHHERISEQRDVQPAGQCS